MLSLALAATAADMRSSAAAMRHCGCGCRRARCRHLRVRAHGRAVADIRLRHARCGRGPRCGRCGVHARLLCATDASLLGTAYTCLLGTADASLFSAAYTSLFSAPDAGGFCTANLVAALLARDGGTITLLDRRPRIGTAVALLDQACIGAAVALLDDGGIAVEGARADDPLRRAERDALMRAPVAIEEGAAMEERPARVIGRPIGAKHERHHG